jgi:HAD superfamily hydrolase (TIGR01509 family)
VFDFDGTLVDTMPLHYEAYRRAFAECCQADLAEGQFLAAVGGTAREVLPRLLEEVGSTASPSVVHNRKKQHLRELLDTADIPVLETAKLLPVLGPHLRMGLATSGSREGIELMLDRLNWAGWFDVVITGEDVVEGKPAPDAFRQAATGLGVPPERCLAFEDTDAGVAAARSAGMQVFDVRATTAPQR